jgi:hypothetical protein
VANQESLCVVHHIVFKIFAPRLDQKQLGLWIVCAQKPPLVHIVAAGLHELL